MEQANGELDFIGNPLKINSVAGTVMENRTHDVLHISTDRNAYGNITDVRSRNEATQEFWIRTASGVEIPISITGAAIPVLPGHRVEVLFANAKGAAAKSIIGIKNHTSGQHVLTVNRHQKLPVKLGLFQVSLIQTLGAGVTTFLTVGGGLFVGFVFAISGLGSFGASILAGLAIGTAFFVQHVTCNNRWMAFQGNLQRLVRDAEVTKTNDSFSQAIDS